MHVSHSLILLDQGSECWAAFNGLKIYKFIRTLYQMDEKTQSHLAIPTTTVYCIAERPFYVCASGRNTSVLFVKVAFLITYKMKWLIYRANAPLFCFPVKCFNVSCLRRSHFGN